MSRSPYQRKLAALSRDRSFLIRAAIVIITVCVVLGFVARSLPKAGFDAEQAQQALVEHVISYDSQRDRSEFADLLLERGEPTPEAIALYIPFFETFVHRNLAPRAKRSKQDLELEVQPIHGVTLAIEDYSRKGFLDAEQHALFLDYANALFDSGTEKKKAIESLRMQAEAEQAPRFANEFLGHVLTRESATRVEAIPYFRKEIVAYPRSDFARFRLLDLNLSLGKKDEVRTLLEADSFRKLVSPRYAVQLGTRLPDLGLLASGTFRLETEIFSKRALPLGILASLVWFIILSKLGGVDRLRSPVLLLFGLALIAGCLSVPLTRVFIVWQEEVFGFVQNGELVNDLIYCISGIGLREELAKIILFLPFVPFIAKRRTTLEILIAAGCVGLGFATVENIGYFDSAGPKEAFPRMVSAAFLHISLTGLLGLALCRFYHYPKRCWEEMVATFVAVVLIHGVYDAFILVPQLSDQFDIFSFLILVLTIKYYFKKIGEARGSLRHDVSPLGVFVIGISLVVGAAWIFALRYYSLDYALEGVGKGFFVSGVLAFVYINEFRHE